MEVEGVSGFTILSFSEYGWLAGGCGESSYQGRSVIDMVWPNAHSGNVEGSSYWPNTTDQW